MTRRLWEHTALVLALILALGGAAFALDWALMVYRLGFPAGRWLISFAIVPEAAAVVFVWGLFRGMDLPRTGWAASLGLASILAVEFIVPSLGGAAWHAAFG